MALIVQKYGGSSLATIECVLNVAKRIIQKKSEGHDLVVVVSAMGNTTNELLELAHKVSSHPPARELDMLLTSGERISIALLAMALDRLGQASISFTGSQSGIVTDTSHTNAKILEVKADRIREQLKLGKVVIVAGFQGVSTEKEITTLGRGGSDVTAVMLAATLGASCCEFYKDIDGVYTHDPKTFSDAKKLEKCSYEVVLNMIQHGSKPLHLDALHLARKYSIPLYIASSFQDYKGTRVS